MFNQSVLSSLEQSVFKLRELFISNGYRKFKMNKFEEYDLYSKNKEFLVSDGVIVFNDTNGKLLALKPDVTLSIIKNSKDSENGIEKFYYNENVYRISSSSHTYKEIMQTGIECIGEITFNEVVETTVLAIKSLNLLSSDFLLGISNVDLAMSIFSDYNIEKEILDKLTKKDFIEAIKECGIVGMGGSGFPTFVKYDTRRKIHTLIVNAVECEPYITSDAMLCKLKAV